MLPLGGLGKLWVFFTALWCQKWGLIDRERGGDYGDGWLPNDHSKWEELYFNHFQS